MNVSGVLEATRVDKVFSDKEESWWEMEGKNGSNGGLTLCLDKETQ